MHIGDTLDVETKEVERRIAHFKEVTQKAGIKLTQQRLEIFRAVAESVDHPSADVVLKALRPRMPTVSLDTIYRTLWLLSDLGLLSTLGPKREVVRFDANLTHHHHYVCVRCGLARDFESADLNALRIPESVEAFGSIAATHIEIRGICLGCANKEIKDGKNKLPRKREGR